MSEIKEKIKKILIQNNFSEETIKVWFDPLGIELDGEKIYIKFQRIRLRSSSMELQFLRKERKKMQRES